MNFIEVDYTQGEELMKELIEALVLSVYLASFLHFAKKKLKNWI